ncbi:hydrogenase formation protein HypD [Anaerotignum sp.]|uniref:hydrogenase formation protein HypD n=1 Tax=Anaerotignum sp. TaxID=2039241 RepID=UPI00332C2DFC
MNRDQEHKKIIRIMEVCGTHTQAISKSGIRSILSDDVKLLSGPGCPVCVTGEAYIDVAIELLSFDQVMLATFGDMLKVRGTFTSLSEKKRKDNVITVYSPEDAITLARRNGDKTVVFLAVGFETTAPIIAATIKNVYEHGPKNLFFLTALKRMEPILRFILADKGNKIDGLICPGHVASVLGADAFRFVTEEFHLPAVVCGFEGEDMKGGVYNLLGQIQGEKPVSFQNLYGRCVCNTGNKLAKEYLNEVFQIEDGYWRGIGMVSSSALGLRGNYQHLDAKKKFFISEKIILKPSDCQCREIILGRKAPYECKKFRQSCTPENPLGPCMISSEGACSAHYKYGRGI